MWICWYYFREWIRSWIILRDIKKNTKNKINTIKDLAYQLYKNILKKNNNKIWFQIQQEIFWDLYPVANAPSENIVDTNGAEDAFGGGFLSQFVKGKKLDECKKADHWVTSIIIQKRGCNIPMDIKFNSNSI